MRHLNFFTRRSNKLFENSALSFSLCRSKLGLLVLPVFLALTFSMCTKNELASHASQIPINDQARRSLLNDIIGKTGDIRNSDVTLRSTTYTISEAIELLDESLNYAYCRPATPLRNTIILSDTIIMEVTTSVSESEIADLFDEASLDLGTQYHDLSLTNQEPWVFTVAQFDSLENGEVPIIVQLHVAYGAYITESIAYGENDDYSYEYGGGMCNSTPGPGAPEILRENLKYDYVVQVPNTKKYYLGAQFVWLCNIPYSDINVCEADGFPGNFYKTEHTLWSWNLPLTWPFTPDNINDWKLFRQISNASNYDECLTGDVEMPFNEYQMGGYIDFWSEYWIPSNYVPANIWVGSKLVEDPESNQIPFHNMIVVFCKKVLVESNDDKIVLPGCFEC